MGQKINPIGLRLGINRTWESRWYANTAEYGDLLHQDLAIRAFLKSELGAEIARVEQYQEGSVPLHTMRADID